MFRPISSSNESHHPCGAHADPDEMSLDKRTWNPLRELVTFAMSESSCGGGAAACQLSE